MPDEREQRKEDYRRRMRALRRWRRFIILCALVACVAVTPALRKGLYDGLHLSELRFGGGLSVRQSLSYWLDTFSANWQSQGTEDILLVNRQHPLPLTDLISFLYLAALARHRALAPAKAILSIPRLSPGTALPLCWIRQSNPKLMHSR